MSRPRPVALMLAVLSLALLFGAAPSMATAATPSHVILAFIPGPRGGPDAPQPGDPRYYQLPLLSVLSSQPELALGVSSATQGRYQSQQAYLDMTQGTRVSTAAYSPRTAPVLTFYPENNGGLFQGWLDARARAATAPADLHPGQLGQNIPGGVAYAGNDGRTQIEALAGVNEAGRIARVSIGSAHTVARRTLALLHDHALVVAGLPSAQLGDVQLRLLLRARPAGSLLIVMESPPAAASPQLLPTGVAGLGAVGALTSASTHLDGVIAGIDLLPTILGHLGVKVPDNVKGQPIRVDGPRDQGGLEELIARLKVVGPQRFPTLQAVMLAWVALLLVGGLIADRRGYRAAMRIGALSTLWILPLLLFTAALSPSKGLEILIVALGGIVLGAVTDRFLAWPRGPLVPCAVTIAAYTIDLALGSPLIIRSLLGSNPLFGSRFYGIGNELEAALPVILFIGLAAALDRRPRSRSMVAWFALSGLALGVVVGSGRLGADVGGVITIGAGTAVAVLFALPGGITRKAVFVAILTPVLALVLLAVLDTVSGGNGHFTRTVLHAKGGSAIENIVVDRYQLAYRVLFRGFMPFAAAIALLALAYGLRFRTRIYWPLEGRAGWTAALTGAVASSLAGALANDSGPVLIVIGFATVAFVTAYVRGDPRLAVVAPSMVAAPCPAESESISPNRPEAR